MFKKTRKVARARQQLLSMLLASVFVFMLIGPAFAAEATTADGSATVQTGEDASIPAGDVVEQIPEVVDPEEKWTLRPIGNGVVRLKKGQLYNDPGVVLLDENGNVQYICLPDKVGVTVLDQMGNRHKELESGFVKIGNVASQYEGIYTLLYSFSGKITFRVVQVSKDLTELPEGKNAPVDSLKFFLKFKDNYEVTVKKGQAIKENVVLVYDQYWRENKELQSKVSKSELDMEKLGYQVLKYELGGKTIYGLVRFVEQNQKLTLKIDDKNVNSQNKMRVGIGSKIVLPEAKVLNSSGKEQTELEKKVVIIGNFDTSKEGTYTMVYDLDGVQLTLTIEVVKDLRATSDDSGSSSSSDSNWTPPNSEKPDPDPPAPEDPDPPAPEDPDPPKPEDPDPPKPENPGTSTPEDPDEEEDPDETGGSGGGTGTTPENPDTSTPEDPGTTPENPDPPTPEDPDEEEDPDETGGSGGGTGTTPENPDTSTPENPDTSTPENPDPPTPEDPDEEEEPDETGGSGGGSGTTPENPDTSTPEDPGAGGGDIPEGGGSTPEGKS